MTLALLTDRTVLVVAIVIALIVLPDWFNLIEHVARFVTYEIYGR